MFLNSIEDVTDGLGTMSASFVVSARLQLLDPVKVSTEPLLFWCFIPESGWQLFNSKKCSWFIIEIRSMKCDVNCAHPSESLCDFWNSILHVFVLVFWKVSVGAVPKSIGGKYNCIFGDRLWEDPHCCAAYAWDGSFDTEAPEKHVCLSCPYCGACSSGELLYLLLHSTLSLRV